VCEGEGRREGGWITHTHTPRLQFRLMMVIVLFAFFRTVVVQLVNYRTGKESSTTPRVKTQDTLTRTTLSTTKQLVLMNSVPPDIMRIRRRPGASHNALNVLQKKKKTPRSSVHTPPAQQKETYEGIDQNRVIQSPNPARIQRLTVKNVDTLQESQSLHPLQPSRLVNVRRHSSGFRALAENLRGRMTRVASSGKGECAGRGGGGLGPGVQTRRGSRKSKDVGQHFFFLSGTVCVYGGKNDGRERLLM